MPQKDSRNCKRLAYRWGHESPSRYGGYACARDRASKQSHHTTRRTYDDAILLAGLFPARRRREQERETLAESFREHVERWKNDTGHLSSIARMTTHPSYLRIIGFGEDGLPLILKELKERPDHWLVALNAITGEDPAPEGATLREAVAAWINWGERKGFC
jgi:hypothetical protein